MWRFNKMKKIDDLEFTDDYMFGEVLKDKEICKGVLERLLKIKVKDIVYPELQKSIKLGYETHGIRMDVYISDNNSVYDIEMQNKAFEDLGKRTRFYQSMIDADFLMAGNDYSELKESLIIFICKTDPFNAGKQVYTFTTQCKEDTAVSFNDKTKKLIYNASKYMEGNDEQLKAFLKFICTNKATDDFTKSLIEKVVQVKNNEIFRTEYNKMNVAFADARRETLLEKGLEDAVIAVKKFSLPPEKVALEYKIPLELLLEELKKTETN